MNEKKTAGKVFRAEEVHPWSPGPPRSLSRRSPWLSTAATWGAGREVSPEEEGTAGPGHRGAWMPQVVG